MNFILEEGELSVCKTLRTHCHGAYSFSYTVLCATSACGGDATLFKKARSVQTLRRLVYGEARKCEQIRRVYLPRMGIDFPNSPYVEGIWV